MRLQISVTEEEIADIVRQVAQNFRSFGGDQDVSKSYNPIDHAHAGKPPVFAGGIDVEQVVCFVLQAAGIEKSS